jgi:hypothetical protein
MGVSSSSLVFFAAVAPGSGTPSRSAAVKNWAKAYLPCLTLFPRRPVHPKETPLAAQPGTGRRSLTMRDDQ